MRNIRTCYPLLLIVVLFSTAAAQPISETGIPAGNISAPAGNMSTTALKELIAESERNLESYRFTLSQDQRIEIINISEINAIHQVRQLTIGSGAFNLTEKTAKVVTASLYYPVGQEENSTAIATEVYVLNDTLYNKIDGNWTAVKLSPPGGILASQNRLNRSIGVTNASEVRLLGTVIEDGEGFYVVEVTPNSSAVSSLIREELGTSFPLAPMNLSSLFNSIQLRYILWISVNNHIPSAEYVQTNMTLTPGMIGPTGKGNTEMHIDSVTMLRFSGFNKSVSIVLPEKAKQARILPLNNTQLSSLNSTQIALNSTQISSPGVALPQGVPSPDPAPSQDPVSLQDPVSSQDPVTYVNSSLTPEMQQDLWLQEAYRFLNGDYYPYGSPIYSSTNYSNVNMPDYLSSYYPYYIPYYSTYYMPYYTPYYTSYASPYYQRPTPVTLGYTAPAHGYTAPAQGYATPAQGYTTPAQGYTAPAQGYTAPTQGYTAATQGYATPTSEFTIMTASNSSLGIYLTDGRGMTLYHLLSDQGRYISNCTDATCTGIWPPYYAGTGNLSIAGNLNPADFSTITVNGYKQYTQTTYKGWPLYYFYKDMKPGDIYGQGVRDIYGVWSVVNPENPNTFPTNFPYPSSGAAAAQYQSPAQQPYTVQPSAVQPSTIQPSIITLSPSMPTYTTPSLYPTVPTPRAVTTSISGNVPVTIRYPGAGPFDVYLDGNYVGTGAGGSFSFSAPAGYHDVRVWDGSFDYEQSILFESGVSKIINVEAV